MNRVGFNLLLLIGFVLPAVQLVADGSTAAEVNTPPSVPMVVTNIGQLHSLSRTDFNRGRRVSFEGTVTMVDTARHRLVLQDATGAVMWYSEDAPDPSLTGKIIHLDCTEGYPFVPTFSDFPSRPSGLEFRGSFEAPSNWGKYHLTRMAGYLRPSRSGQYTFWIASDDSSELWLSTDDDPKRVKKIASITSGFWTNPREWDRFPSQRSEPIFLESNKSYYIEAFGEQGLQDDHLSVAWEGPGIGRSVIPGAYLTPWTASARAVSGSSHDFAVTNGVLCEYWTNFAVGTVAPVTPFGPVNSVMAGTGVAFQVLGPGTWPEPRRIDLREPLLPENNYCWVQAEGVLTFAGSEGTHEILELAAGTRRVSVQVTKWDQAKPVPGQKWRVQVQGVCEGANDVNGEMTAGYIWVPSSDEVKFLEVASDPPKDPLAPPETATDGTLNSGGFYSARGAVMFDGRLAGRRYLYVQDINGSVRVSDADRVLNYLLEIGQRVQVGGTVSPGKVGFQLVPTTMWILGWQALPLPATASDAGYRDGQWTEVEGVVRSVGSNGVLKLMGAGSLISVWIPEMPPEDLPVDCTVRLRGVISMDVPEAPLLLVGSRRFVQIEERGPNDPFSVPLRSISELDQLVSTASPVHRVRIEGTVTYANQSAAFLQDASGAVRLTPLGDSRIHSGERWEAVGFPNTDGAGLSLTEPIFRPARTLAPVEPSKLDLQGTVDEKDSGRLVRVSGNLLAQKDRGPVQVLELQSGQRAFEAVLDSSHQHLPPLVVGSLLEVTGICIADLVSAPRGGKATWQNPSMASLQILLRAPTDVVVRRGLPWWTPMKGAMLIGFLLAVLGATLLWNQLQVRRFERRQLAQLEFSRRILQGQETERRRIAANLHDSLGQNLLVIKNQVRLAMQPAPDQAALSKRLDAISGMASQAIEEVRQITHDLRPYQLERVGLTQTLRGAIRQVSENCPITFASHVDDLDGLWESDGEIHIYRILQEALNNVVKHSGATEATVLVKKELGFVLISVRDNGRGFALGGGHGNGIAHAGFGLSGIDERARILGGKVTFDTRPGQGFRMTVEIPLSRLA